MVAFHPQEEAFDIADQVVVFNRGIVEQSGTPEELQTAPQTPFVMQFVSDTNTLATHHAVNTAYHASHVAIWPLSICFGSKSSTQLYTDSQRGLSSRM